MLIKKLSAVSGKERTRDIPVNPEDMLSWSLGLGSIDDLMPYLNQADRDFILSGITDDEWRRAFVELSE